MIDEKEKAALNALEKIGIEYKRREHPPLATMEECSAVSSESGARHCKNLFLTNKRGSEFYLAMISADKRFKTSVISKILGSSRLSFASEEQLARVLGLTSGSISVTGLVNDAEHMVRVIIDSDILKNEKLLVHPNINTASLEIKTDDLIRFITAFGNEYRVIGIENAQE